MNKKYLLVSLFSFLIVGLLAVGFVALSPQHANAGGSCDSTNLSSVSGAAWSSNIGWIDLSGGFMKYCKLDGKFSGYGWSSIGWVRFDGVSGTAGSNLVGFAQACTALVDKTGCPLGGAQDPNGGSWDGKIQMPGNPGAWGNPARIAADGVEVRGFAWGSDVIGWLSMSPTLDNRGTLLCGQPNYIGICIQPVLTVQVNGIGTVADATNSCANASATVQKVCTFPYAKNTSMTWQGSSGPVLSWTGCDSVTAGNTICLLTIQTDQTITATFGNPNHTLSVQLNSANLTNRLTSDDPNINCLADGSGSCSYALYTAANSPTLTSVNGSAIWTVDGDPAACSAGTTCQVNMSQDHSVIATINGGGTGKFDLRSYGGTNPVPAFGGEMRVVGPLHDGLADVLSSPVKVRVINASGVSSVTFTPTVTDWGGLQSVICDTATGQTCFNKYITPTLVVSPTSVNCTDPAALCNSGDDVSGDSNNTTHVSVKLNFGKHIPSNATDDSPYSRSQPYTITICATSNKGKTGCTSGSTQKLTLYYNDPKDHSQ